ncbi:MarR family transcriptional regulator, partial [Vicingaceae bacterium]|nr:MarR family transcriptional regulator [Vicingaceae bacterium]
SKEQWSVLERISKEEGSNQKDIAKDTFKDPAALTRMLDLLAEKGFVQRKASKNDRRTFDVHLTVEGSRLVNRMSLTLDNFHSTIEKPLTISDKNSLITILLKLN